MIHLETEKMFKISCHYCNEWDTTMAKSVEEAERYFLGQGWGLKDDKTACPDCCEEGDWGV